MTFSLEQQVAQRMILGFPGFTPTPLLNRFLQEGLGGVIFFRDNFQEGGDVQSPGHIAQLLANISQALPAELPPPFLSVDQEGGQVERLPHTVFPATLTPMAIAKSAHPESLTQDVYSTMATHLAQLGFNLNYVPTLDVNLQTENPIIGVRSFGEDPKTVWRLANLALEAYRAQGIVTVGKHFPGHGNGTVDSHEDLPVLDFTEAELWPFQQAIQAGIPAIMVSHGFYPALQTDPSEKSLPASASPTIIQGLLRSRCGFQGIVMTDDMCMGAITKHRDPVEAALAALSAGADMLVYKQSTEAEWAIFQAIVVALRSGKLDIRQHEEALTRICRIKEPLRRFFLSPEEEALMTERFSEDRLEVIASQLAEQALSVLSGNPNACLPLNPKASVLLLHPDRAALHSYAWDQSTSPELPDLFRHVGFQHIRDLAYTPGTALSIPSASPEPDVILFITWNPTRYPEQLAAYRALRQTYPQAKFILASAGTPYGVENLPAPDLHLGLCSYRPATLRVLVKFLIGIEK